MSLKSKIELIVNWCWHSAWFSEMFDPVEKERILIVLVVKNAPRILVRIFISVTLVSASMFGIQTSAFASTAPSITQNPVASDLTYGQALADSSLTGGTASVDGSFAFTLPATIPSAGSANYGVTFTPTDSASYDSVYFDVVVNVSKANPAILSLPTAQEINYGSSLSNSVLSGGSSYVPGEFSFESPNAIPNSGISDQSVKFTPTDTANYNSINGILISVSVNKAIPSVIDPVAYPLTVGSSLSSSVLSGGSASYAGLDVPGTFSWTDGSSIPVAGDEYFSVTFSPSDATNFSSTSSLVKVSTYETPQITGFASWMGSTAPYVTNRGRTFDIYGNNLLNSSFTVGGQSVTKVRNSQSVVRVLLPSDAALGINQEVIATNPAGTTSNIEHITVIEHLPQISGFSAAAIRIGDLLTISGAYLSEVTAVRFSVNRKVNSVIGVGANLADSQTSVASNSITVRVPAGALTGPVRIYTPTGYIQSSNFLVIYPTPKVSTIRSNSKSVSVVKRGQKVVINGRNLSNALVTVGGVVTQVQSVNTASSLSFYVPMDTPLGNQNLVITTIGGVDSSRFLTITN